MLYDLLVPEEIGWETESILGKQCSRIDETEFDRPSVFQFDDLNVQDVWKLRKLINENPAQYIITEKSDKYGKLIKPIWPTNSGLSIDQILDL